MTIPIKVSFADFKDLSGNKRIFVYQGEKHFDFHYFSEGMLVKSTVNKSDIENLQKFFSDKMFFGAKIILLPIPDIEIPSNIVTIKQEMGQPFFDIETIQDAETKTNVSKTVK